MEKNTILVIDDEEHILELLKYNLEINGFKAFTVTNIQDAYKVLQIQTIDAMLLDIMLPDIDGIVALRKFREEEQTKDIPIIMVTAKNEEIDKIIGLELGADDYISKPFSVRELIARIKAVLRRNNRSQAKENEEEIESKFILKDIEIDVESHTVKIKGNLIEFTLKEFEILKLLMRNAGRVLTREVLLDKIWGYDYYGETRTVDVHIRYLRAKLDTYGLGDCIETVRGVGYKFAKE